LTLQQLAEEALGGFPIAAKLDENIDHVTIFVDGTPEILSVASDRNEDLVQVPRVTQPTLTPLQIASIFRAELEAPKPDRLVGNRDAALGEKVFYIPKAETEAVVELYGMTDDFSWKSWSAVARCVALHRPTRRRRNLTVPTRPYASPRILASLFLGEHVIVISHK
jgi:hypothetical protein